MKSFTGRIVTVNKFYDLHLTFSIHRFAARKLIEILQDRDDSNSEKNEIIQLGCKYGIATIKTLSLRVLVFFSKLVNC